MKLRLHYIAGILIFQASVYLTPAFADEPTLEDLRREWSQIFPQPLPVPSPAREAPDVYSILEKEFLLIRPFEYPTASLSRSLRTIREYSPALRQAHAACVKIITPSWHGAGVVISPTGDILTSYHLVAGVPGASIVTLEGRVYSVTNIQAHSIIHDLALLKIPAETPVFLPVDTGAMPESGGALQIVGHPEDTSWKLTLGKVIRHHRDAETRVLHFEAEIEPGNSGGPVVDEAGRLCAITACSAQLTDGSRVKVGVDIGAIREFLDSPRKPIAFTDLTALERNRRMADFLGSLYIRMEDSLSQWLAIMAAVTVETNGVAPVSSSPQLRLVSPKQSAQTAAKLLMLRILMTHCAQMEGLDPRLYRSMADTSASMTHLIDGLAAAHGTAAPGQMKRTITGIALHRDQARLLFGKALGSLEESGQALNIASSAPLQQKQVSALREAYLPAGCHVESPRL